MLGIGPTSPFRLHAALNFVLGQVARSEGHVYLPLAELVIALHASSTSGGRPAVAGNQKPSCRSRARVPASVHLTDDARAEPGPSGDLQADDAHIYSRELFDAECLAAERLAQLLVRSKHPSSSPISSNKPCSGPRNSTSELETEQRRAIATALTRQVSIISGGPGVGKTTSIRILVDLLEQRGVAYMLLSPTGKAAKRLSEATGRAAYTIHRQLFSLERQKEQLQSVSPSVTRTRTSEDVVLPADAVIVDEASMVDLPLLAWLLRSHRAAHASDLRRRQGPAAERRAGLGAARPDRVWPHSADAADGHQAPGRGLADRRGRARHQPRPTARGPLDRGWRPVHPARQTAYGGWRRARAAIGRRKRRAAGRAGHLAAAHLAGRRGALNAALQARLNPPAPGKPEVAAGGDAVFRLGDRLIVGKNNYQTLCFNGETGEIVDIGPRQLTLRMDDTDGERLVEYDRDDWSQLQLAYAITSHRAQGSEWPNVVVVVSQSHYLMLQRNLLYTALTRARRRAVIIVSGGLEHKPSGRIFKSALEVARGQRSDRPPLQRPGRAADNHESNRPGTQERADGIATREARGFLGTLHEPCGDWDSYHGLALDLGLGGKVGLVTGGSRGIGRAIALRLAAEGVTVGICGRTAETLEAALAELRAAGAQAHGVVADVTAPGEVERFVDEAAAALGGRRPAGRQRRRLRRRRGLLESTPEDWARTFELNLFHAVRAIRAAVPHMRAARRRQRGVDLVDLRLEARPDARSTARPRRARSSWRARSPGSWPVADPREHGQPGLDPVSGGGWERFRAREPERFAEFERREFPWGRLGTPEEVADVVVFVLSERATWINGANIAVDGAQGRPSAF